MRKRWILVAVAALAVAGAAGAISGAFAAVTKSSNHAKRASSTKTVTRFCVYVDHTGRGDSNGDLSIVAGYGHKICIVGKKGAKGSTGAAGAAGSTGAAGAAGAKGATGATGPQGPAGPAGSPGSGTLTWNTTVATAGPDFADANTVTLATVGPFTITGYCYLFNGDEGQYVAETYVTTSQDGASLWDYYTGNHYSADFDIATGPVAVGTQAYVDSEGSDWEPASDGKFGVDDGTGTTVFLGAPNNGVFIQGAEGPTCSFSGDLVQEVATG